MRCVSVFVLLAACSDDAPPGQDAGTQLDAAAGADAAPVDAGPEPGLDAAADAAPPGCVLEESGPVEASADGEVIENLRITTDGTPGIQVGEHSGVVIRNCEIHHANAPGIDFGGADGLRIEDVLVVHEGAPADGPNPSDALVDISGFGSADVVIERVKLLRGSSGVYLVECPDAQVRFVEGHDFRGPFPRGQLVQFDKCPDALLEDFSSENDAATSWTEDNVSVYQSPGVTIRRGLVDGNNSPSGVGVMFELSDGSIGGLCEDVDALHQGNGCFSAYPGIGVTFRRTRARDNICSDQGRGAPLSDGLAWAGSPESSGLAIEDSRYFALCAGLVWDESVFDLVELDEEDFTPRGPQRLRFCWE